MRPLRLGGGTRCRFARRASNLSRPAPGPPRATTSLRAAHPGEAVDHLQLSIHSASAPRTFWYMRNSSGPRRGRPRRRPGAGPDLDEDVFSCRPLGSRGRATPRTPPPVFACRLPARRSRPGQGRHLVGRRPRPVCVGRPPWVRPRLLPPPPTAATWRSLRPPCCRSASSPMRSFGALVVIRPAAELVMATFYPLDEAARRRFRADGVLALRTFGPAKIV